MVDDEDPREVFRDGEGLYARSLPLEHLIDTFYVSLPPPPRGSTAVSKRVLLVHGLCQDHSCWLDTAHKLRRRLGCHCVLVDLVGHGRTKPPRVGHHRREEEKWMAARDSRPTHPSTFGPNPLPNQGDLSYVRAAVMARQVDRVLTELAWKADAESGVGPKIVLAGLSLGGAVSLLWARENSHLIERMVLVATAGLKNERVGTHGIISTLAGIGNVLGAVLPGAGSVPPVHGWVMTPYSPHAHHHTHTLYPIYASALLFFLVGTALALHLSHAKRQRPHHPADPRLPAVYPGRAYVRCRPTYARSTPSGWDSSQHRGVRTRQPLPPGVADMGAFVETRRASTSPV